MITKLKEGTKPFGHFRNKVKKEGQYRESNKNKQIDFVRVMGNRTTYHADDLLIYVHHPFFDTCLVSSYLPTQSERESQVHMSGAA